MNTRRILTHIILILLTCQAGQTQVVLNKKDVKCFGDQNGKVSVVSIQNATYPIKNYSWSNGQSGPGKKTIENLAAGTYTVTVTDANDCMATASMVVEGPESDLRLDLTSSSDEFYLCGTASIIVVATPSGGTPPYSTNGDPGAYAIRVSLGSFGDGPKYLDFETTDHHGCRKKHRQYFAFSAIVCSSDPNDITGPAGIKDPRWVAAKDPMEYMIRFENDPELATAPAQVVKVYLPVDPKMDPFMMRLCDFGWGPYTFSIPDNSTYYQTRLNLTDSLGILVDVTAGYNVEENHFFWFFETIDPLTGQIPVNPLLGFLPVNDTTTHAGEGFIRLTVKPKANVVTGDSIRARAEIIFDINEPILTNTWQNKLDAVAPVSQLHPVADTLEDPHITLTWSAQDDPGGVGVADYEILVATDTSGYQVVQRSIPDTFFVYEALPGTLIRVMVLARDSVGNKEALKPQAEDTIYILPDRSVTLVSPSGHHLCIRDSIWIQWSALTTDSVRVEISFDSLQTWLSVAQYSTEDSILWVLHDTMETEYCFIRLTDISDTTVQYLSHPMSIHPLPVVDAGEVPSICLGDFVFLAADGANEYVWDSVSSLNLLDIYNPRATPALTTLYQVTGTDVYGCSNRDSILVTVLPLYLDTVTIGICNGDSVFVGGAYQYNPGFYVDSLATSLGCDSTVITEVVITGPCLFPSPRIYVDQDATGLNDGTSWSNAFTDLQDAIEAVAFYVNVDDIWIAEGEYAPSVPAGRSAEFTLQDTIRLYGGFAGIEDSLSERSANAGLVKITGDIGVPGDTTDNAYHVFRIQSSCSLCEINTMTIQFGHGDGMLDNRLGAGLHVEGTLLIDKCIVERNTTLEEGPAIYNTGPEALLTLRDCIFRLNFSSLQRDILNANGAEIRFEGMNVVED